MKLKLGCDPELFIHDYTGNKYVCAHGIVPGTKSNPFPTPDGGTIQVDGFAVEIGIKPALTENGFVKRINNVCDYAEKEIKKASPNFRLDVQSTAYFDPQDIETAPKEAKELGCEPDYNAYTGKPNPKPDASNKNYRTGGGHVHFGWTKGVDPFHPDHFEACCMLAKQLDVWLALPSLAWDADYERRNLYGGLGSFRPKPYGMEYRVLSNKWLRYDTLMRFVFRQSHTAFNRLVEGNPDYYGVELSSFFTDPKYRSVALNTCMSRFKMDLPRRTAA